MHKDKEQHPLPDKCQLQHAIELLESGKSYKQVETMTGVSKSTLIRAKRKKRKDSFCPSAVSKEHISVMKMTLNSHILFFGATCQTNIMPL